jgi:uncharacterized cupredoxin-like copper-binding protein
MEHLSAEDRMSQGPAVYLRSVTLTQAGGLTKATWHLKPGRYEVYCSLPGHLRKGTRAFFTVSAR